MPTQHDVASLAKVSTASVSRYLRDPESVKPEISERIKSAIAVLDYQVDYSAQALKTGRFSHVGIIASGVAPFFLEMYHAIQARLGELGYFTTLFFTRDMETSTEDAQDPLPLILQKKQLDGVIFFPTLTPEDERLVKRLKSWKKPYLLVNHPLKQKRLPQMYFDNLQGGRTAALAFLERGHREFLFIRGAANSPAARDRYKGFKDALAEHDIFLGKSRVLDGDFSPATTYRIASLAFPLLPRFTAVFASNDASAGGFMKAAWERGMLAPKDYSIIGFDDNPEFAPFLTPPLTSFTQPVKACGQQAAEKIVELINHESDPFEHRVFQPAFQLRESLGPVPGQ